ncbi:MAG TPA: energy transducer TonB [Dyella sp.]|nr:energy transducer TonB [Dyella sp.]
MLFIAGLLMAGPCLVSALAAAPAAQRPEASMLVLGSLTVDTDGHVVGHELEDAGHLPAPVVDLIDRSVARWRFQPVLRDGHAVRARSRMSLRVVAHPTGKDDYVLSIRGVHFGDGKDGDRISMRAPTYPPEAIGARVSGTVYLAVEIDAHGQVADVAAEQVNLRSRGNRWQMERYRKVLSQSAERAARGWQFRPLPAGQAPAMRYAVVPVNYTLRVFGGPRLPDGGPERWDVYMPGPMQAIPWFDATRMVSNLSGSLDALPDGGVYMANPAGGLHLLSKLGGA